MGNTKKTFANNRLVQKAKTQGFLLWKSVCGYFKDEPHKLASHFLQEEWQQGQRALRIAMALGAVVFFLKGFLRIFTGVLPSDLIMVEAFWRLFISLVLFYIVFAFRKTLSYVTGQRFLVWYVFFLITGLVVAVVISPQRVAYTLFPIVLICLMATALWLEGRALLWSLLVALIPVFYLLHSNLMTSMDASNYYFYIPLSIVCGAILRHGRLQRAFEAFLFRQQLAEKAHHDALTGLLNRAGWTRDTTKALGGSFPNAIHSLMYLDLDHFKKINDTLGHAVGDDLLKALATVMRQQMRGTDVLARFGGEEFVVLLPNTQKQEAVFLAERIRKAVSSNTYPTQATVSIGVAEIQSNESMHQAMQRADEALLMAKKKGRNQVVLSQDI